MTQTTAAAATPRNSSKTTRRELNKNRLRGVAAKCFAAAGFDGTSVADILSAAGLSRRTFYAYYSNKHELAASIVDAALVSGCERLGGVLHSDDPIADIVDCYQQLWSDHRHALIMIASLNQETALLVSDNHRRFGALLKAKLQQAEQRQMLRNEDADYSFRVITKTAVPLLKVYADHPDGAQLYRASMLDLLRK